jgi:hypothetical protein
VANFFRRRHFGGHPVASLSAVANFSVIVCFSGVVRQTLPCLETAAWQTLAPALANLFDETVATLAAVANFLCRCQHRCRGKLFLNGKTHRLGKL